MAIIIDPSVAKVQSRRQPSPRSQPPPSYDESATTRPVVVHPGIPTAPHAHAGYGPTPIGQQQVALPYYDPRSVHSVQAAKKRAKGRFFGALLWVAVIYALLSVLIWMNVRIHLGWSDSHSLRHCGPNLADSVPPPTDSQPLLSCTVEPYGIPVLVASEFYILVVGKCWVRCALETPTKRLFGQNQRERVVDHTDDRVEFSRHTFFSLPIVLVPNNSDHDHVLLPIHLVSPLRLWTRLFSFLRFPDPHRMIVVDALKRGQRPTIIAVFSDSYPSPQLRCPPSFSLHIRSDNGPGNTHHRVTSDPVTLGHSDCSDSPKIFCSFSHRVTLASLRP